MLTMLSYERFKELTIEKMAAMFKQEIPDIEVSESTLPMENQVRDILLFLKKHDTMRISPKVYLSELYGEYVMNGDFDFTIYQNFLRIRQALQNTDEIERVLDNRENLDQRIVMELIHTEQNKELLRDLVHREYQDLSIIYRCSFRTENMRGSGYVTDVLAEKLGVTEDELYKYGYENTKRLYKPIIRPLEDVCAYMFLKPHDEVNLEEIPEREEPSFLSLYMMTNSEMNKGAVSFLYKEELQKLAEKLDADLYIMPASVDSVIVTSARDNNPDKLAEIVCDVNATQVPLEDRLSNQVYLYDRQTQDITLATDVEYTMLSVNYESDLQEGAVEPECEEGGMSMGMGV